jgi:hypothetical protein
MKEKRQRKEEGEKRKVCNMGVLSSFFFPLFSLPEVSA